MDQTRSTRAAGLSRHNVTSAEKLLWSITQLSDIYAKQMTVSRISFSLTTLNYCMYSYERSTINDVEESKIMLTTFNGHLTLHFHY